jgi:hypothetical protein
MGAAAGLVFLLDGEALSELCNELVQWASGVLGVVC